MIGTALAAAGSLASAIYGAVASAKQNKERDRLINEQREDNRAWWNIRYNQDYTQRADSQAALNRQRELLQEYAKNTEATNAVAGGTDEAVAVQKAAANKSLAETTSNIAQNAEKYKANVEASGRAQDAALNQQQANIKAQQAQATAQAAAQAVNAGINLAGGLAMNGSLNGNPATGMANAAAIAQDVNKQAEEDLKNIGRHGTTIKTVPFA